MAERTAAPAEAPVSLVEAKAHLRVDHTDDDTLITSMIEAATGHLDGWDGVLGRCLVTQTWEVKYPAWRSSYRLPFPDVQSVALTYTDEDGGTQTVAPSLYRLYMRDLRPLSTFTSPALRDEDDEAVTLSVTAGYGDAADVPAAIKAAILLHVGTLYEVRETMAERLQPTGAYDMLIAPYRAHWL